MEAQEIFEALKSRLPHAVRELGAGTASPFITIEPAHVVAVVSEMRDNAALRFDLLQMVTGVDWRDRFEVVYHLASLVHGGKIALKAVLAHD
ncbi:NADH-quinone oxidoreductase subunit C, partial [Candidatus Sumerlaeota bacterium]|nr:NADH-quinone oxidoreductase subunit C [Candidatus Sumerlaeota bacterium]